MERTQVNIIHEAALELVIHEAASGSDSFRQFVYPGLPKSYTINPKVDELINDGIGRGLSAVRILDEIKFRLRIGTPTYRQYNDPAQQWAEWKRQAYVLPIKDIRRHASVSTSNRHSCRECFCCAAVEVAGEIAARR
jgi:hypothetical protein